jgi:hypothetical protein
MMTDKGATDRSSEKVTLQKLQWPSTQPATVIQEGLSLDQPRKPECPPSDNLQLAYKSTF